MTNEEANALKPGDPIFLAEYIPEYMPGIPASVIPTKFKAKYSKVNDYPFEIADGSIRVAERLHHTEAEARADIAAQIRAKIERLTAELKKWEG